MVSWVAKSSLEDLDRVRVELDCLVRLRFVGPLTPAEQRRYDSLIAREVEILARLDGGRRRYDRVSKD